MVDVALSSASACAVNASDVLIVQLHTAGVGSATPARSVAVTCSWCAPAAKPLSVSGEVHAVAAAPSRAQVNVDAGTSELKVNVAEARFVCVDGPVRIVVLGGWATTAWVVNVQLTGAASGLPARSVTPVVSVAV